MKIKQLVRDIKALPLRNNKLKALRAELGLSRATLARILEVDPSTVFRQELHNPMSMLWYYALQGIAAEARDRRSRAIRREHKQRLSGSDEILGPERVEAEDHRFTAEKMREDTREHAKSKKPPARLPKPSPAPCRESRPHAPRVLPKGSVNAAVERAIARSEASKKT